ncbi:MAG: NADH-quinone oxidoreductase subunit N [Deltaproteobacteria bacterium]|nr:NADH-quinone oxidoreductase subunit N [Deltaproteobacteria bacterium]
MTTSLSQYRFDWVMPEIVVCAAAFLVLLTGVYSRHKRSRPIAGWLTLGGLGIAIAWTWYLRGVGGDAFFGAYRVDAFATFVKFAILIGAAITTLLSMDYWQNRAVQAPEYYALLLFATVGMMLLTGANDLMTVFLAIEIMSFSVYILVASRRDDQSATEAAMKCFMLGAFSSGVLVYGLALVYGATGTLLLKDIAAAHAAAAITEPLLFKIGMGMILVGFIFKVAGVPFHMWAPDVYQGAPAPVTGLMAVGVKAAAFAAAIRVFSVAFGAQAVDWQPVIWWVAVLTILVGNFLAITQDNLKRMLAYSSIAHAGYLLIGLTTGYKVSGSAILFYLVAYTFMNLGAFGVLTAVSRGDDELENIPQWAGIAQKHPALAAVMALCMFSLAGIPPTAGFFAKFYLFYSAIQAGDVLIVLIAVLGSLVSLYYYLRVIVVMYMQEPAGDAVFGGLSNPARVGVLASVAGILYLGLWPRGLLAWAESAIHTLF